MTRTSLDGLALAISQTLGLAQKRDIAGVAQRLGLSDSPIEVGDDCAAIADGDGFLLLAIEGFLPSFVAADPFFAGYCGLMVNLSDIAAMGGRPIAVVDALWARDAVASLPLLDGLKSASSRYGVPIVGGHSNLRSPSDQLAVAVLGRARRLLSGFAAEPGQLLMAAIDLRGRFREPHPFWDASTGRPAERLRGDLELLPSLAEMSACGAAKDISQAGLVGTAVMLLESSGCGGRLDIDAIPRPEGIDPLRWLTSFPSFGFLLAVPPAARDLVAGHFASRDIACAPIGHVEAGSSVRIAQGGQEATVWDFGVQPLIGCGRRPDA
ncbi:hypothetical protein SAMN07250955_11039 [Arboricoccus pini]|uniref:Sll0787 family AIR synthase-like protein n=1 Tax=Arboricoccus pini TaxID=1963835 RepID=A0A212RKM1_9PROT|nr:sll0787 family AIR synthase-like protein [Arboricoccus pini]SNB73009.1 hypothetical protein SAMN07250955_11039 [Arboricoccus pini]